MKRFAKIMACISFCLSMMVPFSVLASDYNPQVKCKNCVLTDDYPYYLFATSPYDGIDLSKYVISAVFIRSKTPILSDKLTTGTVYVFDGDICSYNVYQGSVQLPSWSYTTTSFTCSSSYIWDSNHDVLNSNGDIVFKGTNSDNPPQPDVPTVPSWMETVNVWNPQWMTVVIGSTICSVALGICLDWLVRRFRRSAR